MAIGEASNANIPAALLHGRGTPKWHANYGRERAASVDATDAVSLAQRQPKAELPAEPQWRDLMLEQRQLRQSKRELQQELDRLHRLQAQCEDKLNQVEVRHHLVKQQLRAMDRKLGSRIHTWQDEQTEARRIARQEAAWKAIQQRGWGSPNPVPPQQLLQELRQTRANIQLTADGMHQELAEAKRIYRQVKSHLWRKFRHELWVGSPFDERLQVSYRDENGRQQEASFSIKQVQKFKTSLPRAIRACEENLRAFHADAQDRLRILDLQIQELERMPEPSLQGQAQAGVEVAHSAQQEVVQPSPVPGSGAQPKIPIR